MTYDTLLRGTLITPQGRIERGWVAVKDGVIAAIGQGDAPAAALVHDADGAFGSYKKGWPHADVGVQCTSARVAKADSDRSGALPKGLPVPPNGLVLTPTL